MCIAMILGNGFVASDVHQHADLRVAVDVVGELAGGGLDAHEAADAHVLADLAHQLGAGLFSRSVPL
jgi:hypothetical protein